MDGAPRFVAVDARFAAASRAPAPRPRARRYAPLRYSAVALEDDGAELDFEDDFDLDDELKLEFDRSARAHHRPQRMKYVKCKTRVPPDLLVPYLYGGDRHSRINAIIDRTDCTIDYCPESPSDDMGEQRSAGRYLMSFLVGAETSEQLEAASQMLFVLVDRVQAHVENKAALNAMKHTSDIDSAIGHNDHHDVTRAQEAIAQRSPAYDQRRQESIRSRSLKAEPAGRRFGASGSPRVGEDCETTTAESLHGSSNRPRLGRQWLQDEIQTGASTPQDTHLHTDFPHHDLHFRPRYTGTRYRRPLYRRILVDEDGYEVLENPYERVQLLSPRPSAHLSSPRRRRRSREHLYRQGSSSDEDSQVHRGPSLPTRASLASSRELLGSDDRSSRGLVHDGVVGRASRRVLKRRLDSYDYEEHYPRRRAARRGSIAHDAPLGDLGEHYFSDDGFGEDLNDARVSFGPTHEVYQRTSSDSVGDPTDHNNQGVGSSDNISPPSPLQGSSYTAEVDEVHAETSVAHNVETADSSGVPEDVVRLNLAQEALVLSDGNKTQDIEGEVSFDKPDGSTEVVGSHASASEPEEVIEDSHLPLPTATADPRSDEQSDFDVSMRVDTSDETHAISTASQELTDLPADADHVVDVELIASEAICEPVVSTERAASPTSLQHVITSLDQNPSARVSLNNTMADRFAHHSHVELQARNVWSQLQLIARQARKFEVQADSHQNLSTLAHAVQRVEDAIWRQQNLSMESKQCILLGLDSVVRESSDSSKLLSERVSILLTGLDELLTTVIRRMTPADEPALCQATPDIPANTNTSEADSSSSVLKDIVLLSDREHVSLNEDPVTNLQERTLRASQFSDQKPYSTVTIHQRLTIPAEAPSFVSGLVINLERTSGLSQVMASAQKRLLREISKSDPYYYLHPLELVEVGRKGRGHSCPFGCVGASAHKWERKVVSQISSRMKWFDSVAYSLAKVSGGKELLSRKKMNSTIRKLHLVALQLHCLIAHLYCVRKRATCREIDSLPTALNNSYYEKRMNGYKSRLKLTLHQQQSPLVPGGLPTEELVRDTFEFYPELLLAVDVWGYDYRQSDERVPRAILEEASQQCFDFDNDINGLLQGICEELLSILCRWNDFKWGEGLESLSVEDIVEFEANVKTSIRKILDAHANHLLSQWSQQLSANSHMLNHIRLTQSNVYYSEQTRSITAMAGPIPIDQRLSIFRDDDEEEDSAEDQREDEMTMLHDNWRDQAHSLPSSRKQEILAQDSSKTPLNLSPFREDELMSSSDAINQDRVLSWSQMYDMRQHCHKLAEQVGLMIAEDGKPSGETPELNPSHHLKEIVNRLARARPIAEDAIRTSEKLALHSLNHQFDSVDAGDGDGTHGAGSLADVESMSDGSRDGDDALVDAVLGGIKPTEESRSRKEGNEDPAQRGNDGDGGDWKQPMMKDLVEIVTSTNQEMTEICGQRARSARVRDKLQSQSLELARQSIQIFHTILNMNP